jgi:hypothetical protein
MNNLSRKERGASDGKDQWKNETSFVGNIFLSSYEWHSKRPIWPDIVGAGAGDGD